jgi:1,4-dihydroxy-2-naphthoate octaprenyltransferase
MRTMDMTVIATPPMGRARALVAMARPDQVPLVMLVFTAGLLLGLSRADRTTIRSPDLTVAALLLLAAAVAVHWANEAADAASDARSVRTAFSGGRGALARSGLPAAVPLRLSLALAIVVSVASGVALGVGLLGPVAACLLLAGLVGGLAYSLPPVAAMRRGWGEVLNTSLGAVALPLFGVAVARGRIDVPDAVAFLPFAALTLCSVMATAWPDRAADANTGRRTLQVRWPAARLRRLHASIAVGWLAATVLVVGMGAAPATAAVSGLLVLPFVILGTRHYTRRDVPWPSVAAMVGSIAVTAGALALVVA